jgi:hypothetical protein
MVGCGRAWVRARRDKGKRAHVGLLVGGDGSHVGSWVAGWRWGNLGLEVGYGVGTG